MQSELLVFGPDTSSRAGDKIKNLSILIIFSKKRI